MENHHFSMGKSTISMVIFNSYVKLPEGNLCKHPEKPAGGFKHEWIMFHNILGCHPSHWLIFFRGVGIGLKPPTSQLFCCEKQETDWLLQIFVVKYQWWAIANAYPTSPGPLSPGQLQTHRHLRFLYVAPQLHWPWPRWPDFQLGMGQYLLIHF